MEKPKVGRPKRPIKRSDGEVFTSAIEAAVELGVSPQALNRALQTGTKCMGFTWTYVGQEEL